MTKPICTDIVNQARPESLNFHAAVNAGKAAEAENHTPFANKTDSASKSRVRHFFPATSLKFFFVVAPN
jgi:hypothetical protein